jgi:hypothetical protein
MEGLVLGAFFSLIGVVAFRFGRKNEDARRMFIGGLLLVFPYFFSNPIWISVIGVSLVVALFVRR